MSVSSPRRSEAISQASPTDVEQLRGELRWLSRRCRSHEVTLGHLADVLRTLRAGNRALREENRDLRAELARLRRARQ